jgi:hypothetical protein
MPTKIATFVSVLALALAGSAFAQNYSSPDAKPAAVSHDYSSPDAKPVAAPSSAQGQDLRSPDARPSGRFVTAPPSHSANAGDSFAWGYLALGIGLAAIAGVALTITQRRRHRLVVGS